MCAATAAVSWSTSTPPWQTDDAAVADRRAARGRRRCPTRRGPRRCGPSRGRRRTRSTSPAGCGPRRGRPTRASLVVVGAVHGEAHDLRGALGVASHLGGQVGAGLGDRGVQRRLGRPGRPAPLARSSTVSLVEVHPSTSRVLKLSATPATSARCSCSGVASASVVRTASIVAMFGDEHGRALGHAADGEAVASHHAPPCGGCRWCGSPRRRRRRRRPSRAATSPGRAAETASIGSGMPMRPVEQTSTWWRSTPSSAATRSHIVSASRTPASPVAALAFPLLSTTAAARPSEDRRWSRLVTHWGGRHEVAGEHARGGDRAPVGGGDQRPGRERPTP